MPRGGAKKLETAELQALLRFHRVRISGSIIEVRHFMNLNNKMPIVRLNDDLYLVRSTGELKEYKHTENRTGDFRSLAESMSNARSLINANFFGGQHEIWLTLTYRENMQDSKKLYDDFRYFREKINRVVKTKLSYIAVAEPQARGAWHLHCLFKRQDGLKLFIPHNRLLELWGHGGVDVKRLKGIDNIGAYISAYLTNSEKGKKKQERLKLYPPGMQFYRHSNDLEIPEWRHIDYKEKAILESLKPEYRKAYQIKDEDGNLVQAVLYEQYNMNRM